MARKKCDGEAKSAGCSRSYIQAFQRNQCAFCVPPFGQRVFVPIRRWFSPMWLWPHLRRTASTWNKIIAVTTYRDV